MCTQYFNEVCAVINKTYTHICIYFYNEETGIWQLCIQRNFNIMRACLLVCLPAILMSFFEEGKNFTLLMQNAYSMNKSSPLETH